MTKSGHRVVTASEGRPSLARAKRSDVIVLDMLLPKLEGAQLLEFLKADPLTAKTPVVVLSSLSQKNKEKLMAAGAAVYLEKSNLARDQSSQEVTAVTKTQRRGDLDVITKRLDAGILSLVVQFQAAFGDTEQFVVPRAHGHAAGQSGPKTYSRVKIWHACGGVFQRLGPVSDSSVRISMLIIPVIMHERARHIDSVSERHASATLKNPSQARGECLSLGIISAACTDFRPMSRNPTSKYCHLMSAVGPDLETQGTLRRSLYA